ncbi:MAG: hypothetical protein SPL13_02735 [Clostridia bacterium]|nr:hypothetical protein [Clostridia bacterium]
METYYTSINGYSKTVITVYNKDDLYKVVETLEFISKLLCVNLDYDINFDEKEIIVSVDDYYEFNALRRKLYDHCAIA